jgi:5S rRNA maturation endonuclease (ribonuclease M5)
MVWMRFAVGMIVEGYLDFIELRRLVHCGWYHFLGRRSLSIEEWRRQAEYKLVSFIALFS